MRGHGGLPGLGMQAESEFCGGSIPQTPAKQSGKFPDCMEGASPARGSEKERKAGAAWKQHLFNQWVQSPRPEQQPRQVERGRGWGKRETSLSCFHRKETIRTVLFLRLIRKGFRPWLLHEMGSSRGKISPDKSASPAPEARYSFTLCHMFPLFLFPLFACLCVGARSLQTCSWLRAPAALRGPLSGPMCTVLTSAVPAPPQEPQQGDRTPSGGSPPRVPHLVWLVRIADMLCPLDGFSATGAPAMSESTL